MILDEGGLKEQVSGIGVILQELLKGALRPLVSASGLIACIVEILCNFVNTPAAVIEGK